MGEITRRGATRRRTRGENPTYRSRRAPADRRTETLEIQQALQRGYDQHSYGAGHQDSFIGQLPFEEPGGGPALQFSQSHAMERNTELYNMRGGYSQQPEPQGTYTFSSPGDYNPSADFSPIGYPHGGPYAPNLDENGNEIDEEPMRDEYGNIIDSSYGFTPGGYYRHRRSTITQITGDVNSPNTTNSDQSAQFQAYLTAYQTASAQISSTLFPYLDNILKGSNSSLTYNMAWSLYADLTGAPIHVVSPFFNGLNCIDWIEETWRNQTHNGTTITVTNSTTHANTTEPGADIPMLEWLYSARTLLPIYEEVWENMTKAANQSLTDLATLSLYLQPKDQSIVTSDFMKTANYTAKDFAYFTVRNQTMGK